MEIALVVCATAVYGLLIWKQYADNVLDRARLDGLLSALYRLNTEYRETASMAMKRVLEVAREIQAAKITTVNPFAQQPYAANVSRQPLGDTPSGVDPKELAELLNAGYEESEAEEAEEIDDELEKHPSMPDLTQPPGDVQEGGVFMTEFYAHQNLKAEEDEYEDDSDE